MKKKLFTLLALLVGFVAAYADDVTVTAVGTVMPGGEGYIDLMLTNPNEEQFGALSLQFDMPEGVDFVVVDPTAKEKEIVAYPTDRIPASMANIMSNVLSPKCARVAYLSLKAEPISGTSGSIGRFKITGAEDLVVGSTVEVPISDLRLSEMLPGDKLFERKFDTFNAIVTVVALGNYLDESSTEAPKASTGIPAFVKRTIKANEWSTIVLPFAMTADQVKAAFGDDVQLADFAGYEPGYDDDDNIESIKVNFTTATAIEANHPYLIKVSSAISEFSVDNAEVDPAEELVNAAIKRSRKAWSEMIGTYVAGTEVPEACLFLSGDKFYYSTGATKMKGFRAYFDLSDILTEVEELSAKFIIDIDGQATSIDALSSVFAGTDAIFDVNGKFVGKDFESLPAGIYIVGGKKVIKK